MSRRYPGTYRRGGGWWISYRMRGKRVREHGGPTQKQAWEFRQERLRQVVQRQHLGREAEQLTVADVVRTLVVHLQNRGIKAPRFYQTCGRTVTSRVGTTRCVDLTADDVERFIEGRRTDGRKPATINRELSIWRQALRLAVEQKRLPEVPVRFRLLRENNVRRVFWERSEVEHMVQALPDPYGDLVLWAYWSGWRRGEIVGLTWDGVDREHRVVKLPDTKSGRPRTLALEGVLWEVAERRRQERQHLDDHGHLALARHVFHRNGRPVRDWRRAWATASRKAGVSGKHFHDFRRSAAREMINSGVPQSTAMEITGHVTDAMFRRYDIRVVDDQRQALQRRAELHQAAATDDRGVVPMMAAGNKAHHSGTPAGANSHVLVTSGEAGRASKERAALSQKGYDARPEDTSVRLLIAWLRRTRSQPLSTMPWPRTAGCSPTDALRRAR